MVGDETIKIDGRSHVKEVDQRRVVPGLADGVLPDECRRGGDLEAGARGDYG